MGVSGAGKSTLSRALSQRLRCPFIDGDTLHAPESVAKMSAGIALTDEDRWPWLDRVGMVLREVVQAHGTAVAACSALKRVYRERLSRTAAMPVSLLWLRAGQEILPARLRGRSGHFMPPELLASQLETLEPPAPPERWLELDAARPVQRLVDDALSWLDYCPT